MAKSHRSSPAERRSWRTADKPQNSAGGLRRKRFLVTGCGTLLLAVFVVALVYLLWPAPKLQIASLVIDDYDLLAAPPIAYAGEDRDALADCAQGSTRSFQQLKQQQAANFSTLGDELAASGTSGGVLLLYVSAHGVSIDGRPVLLCSDYNPRNKTGIYPFADLIKSVCRNRARNCLLVLDTGRLETDLTAGMLVNEFPRLVEDEVRQAADADNLWVILSNSFLERSLISRTDRRSAFSYFFCEGLRGDADAEGDQDQDVELNELAKYLQYVNAWCAKATGATLTQQPVLLHGGEGRVREPPELFLTRRLPPPQKTDEKPVAVNRSTRPDQVAMNYFGGVGSNLALAQVPPAASSQEAPSQAASPPAVPGAAPAAPPVSAAEDAKAPAPVPASTAPASTNSSSTAPTTDASANPAPSPPTPPSAPAATAPNASQHPLFAEWQSKRQQILAAAQRQTSETWTPVDYAPHLWRAYEEMVAHAALRMTAGKDFETPEAQSRAKTQFAELDRVWERINGRKRQFYDPTDGQARASYDRNPGVRETLQARNELFDRLPRYIAFYAQPSTHGRAAEVGRDLDDALQELRDVDALLVQSAADPNTAESAAEATAISAWVQSFVERRATLIKLRNELDGFLQTEANLILGRLRDRLPLGPADPLRLRMLLASDLLSETTRQQVVAALPAAEFKLAKVAKLPEATAPSFPQPRLADRAKLELQLLGLNSDSPPQQNVPRTPASSPAETAKACEAYRALGSLIAAGLGQLPGEIEKNFAELNLFQRVRQGEVELRLATARDATAIDDLFLPPRPYPIAALGLPLRAPRPSLVASPRLVSALSTEISELRLVEPRQALAITYAINGTPTLPGNLIAKVQFDPKLLEVLDADGKPITPGREVLVRPSTNPAEAQLPLSVSALSATGAVTSLNVEVKGGQRTASTDLRVLLPQQTHLEFVVAGRRGAAVATPVSDVPGLWRVPLRPFPNPLVDGKPEGESTFQFEVRDSAGRGRKLKYELWALPLAWSNRPADRSPSWGTAWQAPPGSRPLVPQQDLEIPASGSVAPPLAAPPPMPAAPATAPPAEPAPAADPGTPIEGGLLAVFEDPQSRERQLIWLDAEVMHPAEYLREPRVSYDREQQQINIVVSPQNPDSLPVTGSKINWEDLPASESVAQRNLNGVLDPARPEKNAVLYAKIPRQRDAKVAVHLQVDGYPRAFIYYVDCWNSGLAERQVLDLHGLQIKQPADGQVFGKLAKLPVGLRVDVPRPSEIEATFVCRLGINPGNQGDLSDAAGEVLEFHRDRRQRIWLLPPTVPGQAVLQAAVDDLEAALNTSNYENDQIAIRAELWRTAAAGADQDRVAKDSKTIILDTRPPEIRPADGGSLSFRGEQEKLLPVRLRVTDEGSGLRKLEVAFAHDNGKLKDPVAAREVGANEYEAAVPTAGRLPGKYELFAQATDKAENVTPAIPLNVTIAPPALPTPGATPSKNNRLFGTVGIGDQRARGITVTLMGPKSATATSDGSGKFEFANLPPGAYKITAKGTFRNRAYQAGPVDVTVESPPAPPTEVPISLE